MEPFSADSLEAAFRDLSRELQWHHVRAHIYVIGGAAMALGFDNRRHTMDVDALIKRGHGPVVDAVRRIGRRRGWPDTWLNEEAVSGDSSRQGRQGADRLRGSQPGGDRGLGRTLAGDEGARSATQGSQGYPLLGQAPGALFRPGGL